LGDEFATEFIGIGPERTYLSDFGVLGGESVEDVLGGICGDADS
jgi:hypothetical protein